MFGCVGHVKIAKRHLKKLEDKSKKMVHLGVEKGTKAYRLLDPDTGSICVSRDVVFEEDKEWEWEKGGQDKGNTRYELYSGRLRPK